MDQNEQIRRRAHQIWEAEGRPEGQAARHWAEAEDELGTDLPGSHASPEGDNTLFELPAEIAAEGGRADGRIIEAGEGGVSGGPDEAEEALGLSVPRDDPEGQ